MMQFVCLLLFQLFSIGLVNSYKLDKEWWHDFEGTIGNEKIMLSVFYAPGNSLKGSYCYSKYGRKMELSGFTRGDSLFLLESLDNQITGSFTGVFTFGKMDNIVGFWVSSIDNQQLQFSLHLVSAVPGQPGKRYSLPVPDELIEGFAATIIEKVKIGDKKGIAEMVHYPIEVFIEDKKVIIHNQAEFVKQYNKIFNNQMVEKITNCHPFYLFEKYQAIMLADGEIWYGQPSNEKNLKILIISLNTKLL